MSTRIKNFISRSFVFLCIMAVFITILPAQIAYYDAIELSKKEYGGDFHENKITFTIEIDQDKINQLINLNDENLKHSDINTPAKFLDLLKLYNQLEEKSILFELLMLYANNIEDYKDNPFIKIQIKITKDELEENINKVDGRLTEFLSKNQDVHFAMGTFLPGFKLSEEYKSMLTTAAPTASGISVPTIVEGMAKFLVERAKQELSIAFFQKFKDELAQKKTGYEILNAVFPETFVILQTIGEEIYNFSSYIQVLREAFEKDLSNIYTNLPRVLEVGQIKEFFEKNDNKNKWLKNLIETAFFIIDGLKEEKHPGEILAEFDVNKLSADIDNVGNIKNAIELLKIISNSLKEKDGSGRYWINKKSLNALFEFDEKRKEYVVFNLYLGLLYQQSASKAIKFKIGENDIDFAKEVLIKLKSLQDKTGIVKKLFDESVKRINMVDNAIKTIKELEINQAKPEGQKLTFEDYYEAYNTVLDTVEYMLALGNNILKNKKLPESEETLPDDSKLKKFVKIARSLGDTYLSIKYRNYGIAVFKIINVSDIICDLVGSGAENNSIFNDIRSKFLKYGAFMAAVTQAKTSDDVKKAIESVVLPIGSYRIKRTRSWSISLNSYVGILPGIEKYIGKYPTDNNNNTPPDKEWINNLAITAPIGLAVNKGFSRHGKYVSSISLFVSLIDLGAIVRYRFEKEDKGTTKEEKGIPGVTWKDIFSPGAFLIFGPKNLPLSFGVGIQVSPQIKKVYDDGSIDRTLSRIRWGLMIAVDIPLIHFK